MTIAPVMHSVQVKIPPAQAFELLATRMGQWWPQGRTIGRSPHADIVLEPWEGGRWFERDAEGVETRWGKVLAWQPPERLLLGWQLNRSFTYDPDTLTEVELTFAPAEGGGTIVTLEHRNLERYGADAAEVAGKVRGGWATRLAEFVAFATAAG